MSITMDGNTQTHNECWSELGLDEKPKTGVKPFLKAMVLYNITIYNLQLKCDGHDFFELCLCQLLGNLRLRGDFVSPF